MLRWKLFVILAVIFVALGLAGNKYITGSAHRHDLTLLEDTGLQVAFDGDKLRIDIESDESLTDVFNGLEPTVAETIFANYSLRLGRLGFEQVDSALSARVDLILAQAVATGEFYTASTLLEQVAKEQGYKSSMIMWGQRLVAEIANEKRCYIALLPWEVGQ